VTKDVQESVAPALGTIYRRTRISHAERTLHFITAASDTPSYNFIILELTFSGAHVISDRQRRRLPLVKLMRFIVRQRALSGSGAFLHF